MQSVVEIQRQTPFGSQVVLAEHIEIIVQRLAGTQVASQLQAQLGSGSDTYSYLLALVEENRPGMGKGIRVQTGQRLYCPNAETLARFDAMSPAQRQQQFARLEQQR